MRKGTRIYVRTPLFEGWATIQNFVACPFYPIAIKLDDGDSDGHKFKRINDEDIVEVVENVE